MTKWGKRSNLALVAVLLVLNTYCGGTIGAGNTSGLARWSAFVVDGILVSLLPALLMWYAIAKLQYTSGPLLACSMLNFLAGWWLLSALLPSLPESVGITQFLLVFVIYLLVGVLLIARMLANPKSKPERERDRDLEQMRLAREKRARARIGE